MRVADRMDAVYAEVRGWRRDGVNFAAGASHSAGHSGEATPMELGQARQEFRGNCFNCGEYGHKSSECTKPPACPRNTGRGRGRGGAGNQRGAGRGARINNLGEAEEGSENE